MPNFKVRFTNGAIVMVTAKSIVDVMLVVKKDRIQWPNDIYGVEVSERESIRKEKCKWIRSFDGHFNISCPSGERANGQFKPDKDNHTTWDFKYCPYCGREIKLCQYKRPKNNQQSSGLTARPHIIKLIWR